METHAIDDTDLKTARELARAGRTDAAERAYSKLLDTSPEHAEALNFLAQCALRRGQAGRALELLETCASRHPADLATLLNLGVAREANGNFEGARNAFQRVLEINPALSHARLQLGHALEALGRSAEALLAYHRAISDQQRQGHWLNAASTPAAILDRVRHAMRFVKAGRRRVFEAVLEPLIRQHGAATLRRVADCLTTMVGDRPAAFADARQKPSFLYFPDLPATPYFDRRLFPWIEEFEDRTGTIRTELMEVLALTDGCERVFGNDAEERAGLSGAGGAPVWNGFYFYRNGMRREVNHRRCSGTAHAIDALPLVQIRDHAPEVLFSVLTPGTHILPHRGVTNTRVVCHLPLIVPENCALIVGGETHHWREGRAVVFDDTFEHEAWNRGSRTRVVLIVDVWNPHLSPAECEAVATLIEAIGDFNRASAA
ncbi:MAG: aspartyl/asparaginyl beta-hydroxylase domain-containing protein [Steroidobacteraceae bacterium]